MEERKPRLERGYIQIYTGEGKGKTTAALGLAIRASGHGLRTYIGQFMKGQPSGENMALQGNPFIHIEQYGEASFLRREEISPRDIALAQSGLERALSAMTSGEYDIVILDEVNTAVWFGLLKEEQVLELLDRKPPMVELILTGRRAPEALLARADLITEMHEVKHYFRDGVTGRSGIEK